MVASRADVANQVPIGREFPPSPRAYSRGQADPRQKPRNLAQLQLDLSGALAFAAGTAMHFSNVFDEHQGLTNWHG
jgi:hypothetical protein